MKTAMQELIEYLESNDEIVLLPDLLIKIIKDKYLIEERKQHETTFHRGINIGALNPKLDIEGRKEASKHYYECTFVILNNQNLDRIQDISIG